MATRSSGGTRLLSNEYLMKKATQRKAANPPSQAKPFTPMNCSQLMAGLTGRGLGSGAAHGGMGEGLNGDRAAASRSGGRMSGAGTWTGGGAGAGASGWVGATSHTAASAAVMGVGGVSCFAQKTWRSTSPRRRVSSSIRLRALTARTMSQMASATGAPMTRTTISSIKFPFDGRRGLMARAVKREWLPQQIGMGAGHGRGAGRLNPRGVFPERRSRGLFRMRRSNS